MIFFSPPFSFIAAHPMHDGSPVIIDQTGNLVAVLLAPTTGPEDVEAAKLELTRIGVAMAEAIK